MEKVLAGSAQTANPELRITRDLVCDGALRPMGTRKRLTIAARWPSRAGGSAAVVGGDPSFPRGPSPVNDPERRGGRGLGPWRDFDES